MVDGSEGRLHLSDSRNGDTISRHLDTGSNGYDVREKEKKDSKRMKKKNEMTNQKEENS